MNERTVFTYENVVGKITFEYASPYWITDIRGISSIDVDISKAQGYEQVGTSITAQSVQPRTITIDGALFDPLTLTRAKLLSIFAPQVKSTLTATIDGVQMFLNVVPLKTPEITPGNGIQYFQTQLYAAYPYWQTVESYTSQVAGITPMFKFPFNTGGKWWISRFSGNYYATIQNEGNVPIGFKAVFTANSTLYKPEVYHLGTQKLIRVDKTMAAGERIIVSTLYGDKGVTCIDVSGVETNGFKYLSYLSDLSMALLPGENMIRINAQSNREGLSVRVVAPKGVRSGV